MFQFIHAADLHLDTPFEGIGRVAPEIANSLRDASLDSLDALINLAIARQVAFIIISGDVYDGADRGLRAQLRFLGALERLGEQQIQVFIIYGNHDPLDGWSVIRSWPAHVTVFGSDDVEMAVASRNGTKLASIYGMSYPTRQVTENLALRYKRGLGPGIHIAMLHCNLGSNDDHAAYSPCTLNDLMPRGMDYWALGHIHRRQIIHEGNPWVVYPGNLQGRSAKPSERGSKGVYVVTVDGTTIQPPEFVPLDRARFVQIEIDLAKIEEFPELHRVLRGRAEVLIVEHDGCGLLIRATLTGRGPLHTELIRAELLPELLQQLRDEAASLQPFLWWDAIRDETASELNLDEIRRRGDFLAEVLRISDGAASDPDNLSSLFSDRLGMVRTGTLSKLVPSLDGHDEQRELLREATELALDLLESRG